MLILGTHHFGVCMRPQSDGFINAPCGEVVAVGVELDAIYIPLVTRVDPHGVRVLQVPQLGCPVHRTWNGKCENCS